MKYTVKKILIAFLNIILCGGSTTLSWAVTDPGNEYLDMDIAQLMQITVTSVAKKPQNLSDAAAAVFVITQDDIHRSGVTSIPEALRMVPGLQVARIGAEKWAISARGFAGQTANKLLVLMDGRTLYSPSFSGVYWDVQDTLIEDIDRIEVIRGPGGTIWGANAVNGIINIITKKAGDTEGALVRIAAGNEDQFSGGVRYGVKMGEAVYARAYLTYRAHDSFELHETGGDANDDWQDVRGGFRLDSELIGGLSWTLQGDVYSEDASQLVSPHYSLESPYVSEEPDSYSSRGWNLLAKMEQQLSKCNSWSLQTYYDYTLRDEFYIGQTHKTFDVEFQYQFKYGQYHDFTWGLGYRNIQDDFDSSFQLSFAPEKEKQELFSSFIQDEIALVPGRLWMTLGAKIEHNDYTGYEVQPSGRLLLKLTEKQRLWGSISRAVRTPSRIERDATLITLIFPDLPPYPAALSLQGNRNFDSEEVLAYELGYRVLLATQLSLDIALFYNEYENLRSSTLLTFPPTTEIRFENRSQGSSYGFEVASDWKPGKWIAFQLGYSYLYLDLDVRDEGAGMDMVVVHEDSSPRHQISLRSTIDTGNSWQINLWLRYVDEFAASGIAALAQQSVIDEYWAFDANISWHPWENLELMLVGQNLFSSGRLEFVSEYLAPLTNIEPGMYGKLTYRF